MERAVAASSEQRSAAATTTATTAAVGAVALETDCDAKRDAVPSPCAEKRRSKADIMDQLGSGGVKRPRGGGTGARGGKKKRGPRSIEKRAERKKKKERPRATSREIGRSATTLFWETVLGAFSLVARSPSSALCVQRVPLVRPASLERVQRASEKRNAAPQKKRKGNRV